MKQTTTSIAEYPAPDSYTTEMQVLADIIALPETLIEAERLINAEMFTNEECRNAYNVLRTMSKEGMAIDLPSVFGKIDQGLIKNGIAPMMANVGGVLSSVQHYSTLRDFSIKRRCYQKAIELLASSTGTKATAQDLIGWAGSFAENLRKDAGFGKSIQHISSVLNELGEQIEEKAKEKAAGKALRTPSGFHSLDHVTFGGFNAGNLVILAARPSVGKTAVMLHMARSAAQAGKAVNLYNLEMTNTELAQRFLCATEKVTPLQMARADVDWSMFEVASKEYASKPIYLSDSLYSEDEIIASITLNSQAGNCGIAFIDYLGLVALSDTRSRADQAIGGFTKRLKQLAKTCRIPIVLLCQLNRSSASERRSPELYDLRDSGSIEQDADIVLMLERSTGNLEDSEVTMWVRKNRQGKAGDVKVELIGNSSFTSFKDKNDPTPPPPEYMGNDFDDSDIPF